MISRAHLQPSPSTQWRSINLSKAGVGVIPAGCPVTSSSFCCNGLVSLVFTVIYLQGTQGLCRGGRIVLLWGPTALHYSLLQRARGAALLTISHFNIGVYPAGASNGKPVTFLRIKTNSASSNGQGSLPSRLPGPGPCPLTAAAAGARRGKSWWEQWVSGPRPPSSRTATATARGRLALTLHRQPPRNRRAKPSSSGPGPAASPRCRGGAACRPAYLVGSWWSQRGPWPGSGRDSLGVEGLIPLN